ncbi:MAG: sugar transferase, partial [Candidatus Margulisbacteria bacterium]|nr:sugar transferase [Candidatus Margulisiibacteriota bacterium]
MILVDGLIVAFSFFLAYFLRFKILLFITPETIPLFHEYTTVLIFITLIWLAIFQLLGLYDKKKLSVLIDEIASIFLAVTFGSLALLGLLFLYKEYWVSRLVILNAWGLSFLLLTAFRLLLTGIKYVKFSKGWGRKNVLILGAGEIADLLVLKIRQNKFLGYNLVGTLAQASNLRSFIKEKRIQEIIIANTVYSDQEVLDIITECENLGVEFKLVPGILELIASRLDVDELGGVPLLTVSEIQLKGFKAFIKRSVDLCFSLFFILFFSPIFIVFPILVKSTSKGPVFFCQQRVGIDGQFFPMFKFRSMIANAEELLPEIETKSEAEGHLFKIKDDPRVTPLGCFMRHWSIDELPQLFNVLFGQMSLVGPRPPLPREVEKYSSWHKKRLRVRPGITGPWQVAGRSLIPFEEMVRL